MNAPTLAWLGTLGFALLALFYVLTDYRAGAIATLAAVVFMAAIGAIFSALDARATRSGGTDD